MHKNRQFLAISLFLTLVLSAFPVHAKQPDPQTLWNELFEACVAHVKHRRFELALSAAKAALAIRRTRELLCNAGMAAARLERFTDAAEFLGECIELTTDESTDNKELQRRLIHAATFAMARTHVGTLRVIAPPLATIYVNHRKIGLAPIDNEIFVPANQNIEIVADNFDGKGSERVTIAPGQSKTVVVRLQPKTKALVSKLPEPIPPMMARAPTPLPSPPSLFSSNLPFRVSLIGTLTAAGASAHFWVASRIDAANYQDQLQTVQNHYTCGCECSVQPDCTAIKNLRDRSHGFNTLFIGSAITTGIGLGVTIALGKYLPVRTSSQGLGFDF